MFFDPSRANPRAGSRIDVAGRLFVRGRHAAPVPCHTRAADRQAPGKCSPKRETIYRRSRRPGHRSDCSMRPPRQAHSFLAVPHMPAHSAHCPAGRCLRTYLNRQSVLRRLWFRPSPPCCLIQAPLSSDKPGSTPHSDPRLWGAAAWRTPAPLARRFQASPHSEPPKFICGTYFVQRRRGPPVGW